MANDSTTSGFLAPSASPVYDNPLDDIFQAAVVGITGLPGSLVRPRWQPEPPQQPAFDVNWCALGAVRSIVDTFSHEHVDENGDYRVERDETLYVLHSFYGPAAHSNVERLRDGLDVPQNRDTLAAAGVGVVEIQEATILPALLKEKWVRRVDVTVVYRRRTQRAFPVLTVTSAQGSLVTDAPTRTTPIVVNHS